VCCCGGSIGGWGLAGHFSKCNISASTGANSVKLVSMETPMRVVSRRVVGGETESLYGDGIVGRRQWVWQDWKMLLLFYRNSISASTGANSTKLVPMDSPMRVVYRRVVIVARKCWYGVGIVGRRQQEWRLLVAAAAVL
jgi:hypothetical protein